MTDKPLNVIYGLSCTCHPEDGIRYVGQTSVGVDLRLYRHKYAAQNPDAKNDYHVASHRWIRKHGVDNVIATVLEVCESADSLDEREIYWIAEMGTFGGRGLNLSEGGASIRGYKHTDETRTRMSGRVYSGETRAKMSDAAKKRSMKHLIEARPDFRGETSWNARLADADVAAIKEMLWDGNCVSAIAKLLDVNISLISHISGSHSWTHIPWPIGPRRKPETSKLMSELRTGRKHSDKTRAKQRSVAIEVNARPEVKAKKSAASSGARNAMAKITEDDVREIRRIREEEKLPYAEIGKRYGLGPEATSMICRRITWASVS